ncbi:hypothetical protein ADU37_CDS00030 [Thermococcus sp. 2319x1]|uniref:transglutaminase-like domain-containing protein n=1 Tax=Thermococcus sp. 2319x1 TaxID=1674923 RepID=UPI00073ACD6E|nr:transglutaminase-like domain-containing protein [Thermococcus sp. 2319x1]ALV61702.1 hypothetical protein ADU37_CDS00030 [Thermococcus sp. 2319x1]
MGSKVIVLLLFLSMISGCISYPRVSPTVNNIPTEECGDVDYYFLGSAIECTITPEEIEALLPVAGELKEGDIREDVWKILEWEESKIEYDFEKASLPPAKITTYPTGKVEISGGSKIQSPSETVNLGRGICTDYTVLTLALLFATNYTEAYALEINFENSETGHAAALVKIDGKFFVLDQRPPVMDLGSYYLHWKKVEGKTISNATLYRVLWNNGAKVEKIGIFHPSDFLREDYTFTNFDASRLAFDLMEAIEDDFPNLRKDENLKSGKPIGYSSGKRWGMTFPNFAMYYNPEFHEQFVGQIYSNLKDTPEILADLGDHSYFWVDVKAEGDDLKIELVLVKGDQKSFNL